MDTTETPLVGYRALSEFLTNSGFPIACSTLEKYCSPAINIGPPIKAYWKQSPTFLPSQTLAWARGRLRSADAVRSQPGRRGRPRKEADAVIAEATA
jgi:hypothetical protein